MAVDGHEYQQGQHAEELRDHDGLGRTLRIISGSKAQSHLVADHVAGHVNCAEDEAHGKAHGKTNDHLLGENQETQTGGGFDDGDCREGRRNGDSNGEPEKKAYAHGKCRVVERRSRNEQGQNTRQREKKGDDPGVQFGRGQADHGAFSR